MAAWMTWAALCAAWLAAAAWGAERVLLRGRGPVRAAWGVAMALAFVVPVVAWLRPDGEAGLLDRAVRASLDGAASASSPTAGARGDGPRRDPAPTPSLVAFPPARASDRASDRAAGWSRTLARADRPLVMVWAFGSGVMLLHLAGGMLLLARRRRRWARRDVLGVPVLVSEVSGPAVVGVRRAAIVLPAWALALEPSRLALVLRHEQEHVRARDALLLWAAQLAVVAAPWNPALWWMLARLRAAVEIDCDARVLRATDARSYATLLLDVVRPDGAIAGVPAFAEHARGLERRIRTMAARRAPAWRGVGPMALAIGGVAVALACEAPRPRGVGEVTAPPVAAIPTDAPAMPRDPSFAALAAEAAPGCEAIPWKGKMAHVMVVAADSVTPGRLRLVARRSRAPRTSVSYARPGTERLAIRCAAPADSGVVRLYGRGAFDAAGGTAVVSLDVDRVVDVAVVRPEDARVVAQLTIDPDTLRAGANARVVELAWPNGVAAAMRRGERCRAMGLVVDGESQDRCAPIPAAELAAIRARAAQRTVYPGRVGQPASVAFVADTAAGLADSGRVARNTYERLFRGIALAPEAAARARAIALREAGEGLRLMHEPSGSPWAGYRRATAMLDRRDSTLRALLATERDRRTFDANAAALRP